MVAQDKEAGFRLTLAETTGLRPDGLPAGGFTDGDEDADGGLPPAAIVNPDPELGPPLPAGWYYTSVAGCHVSAYRDWELDNYDGRWSAECDEGGLRVRVRGGFDGFDGDSYAAAERAVDQIMERAVRDGIPVITAAMEWEVDRVLAGWCGDRLTAEDIVGSLERLTAGWDDAVAGNISG